MKKFIAVLLSVILILPAGTTALAEPGIDMLTAPGENEDVSGQTEDEENSDWNVDEDGSLSNEEWAESLLGEDEVESPLQDTESEYEAELQDSITEELEELEELESEEDVEDEEEKEDADEEELEVEELSTLSSGLEVEVKEYISEELLLSYDDRYDLSELSFSDNEGNVVTLSSDEQYVILTDYDEESDDDIRSYKVSEGKVTNELDDALITLKDEDTTVAIATGVGTGTVWLVRKDQEDTLRDYLEEQEQGEEESSDTENQDGDLESGDTETTSGDEKNTNGDSEEMNNNGEETTSDSENSDGNIPSDESVPVDINVYGIRVTIEAAPLTLMFLVGQSNMEGYCDSVTGYKPSASIACEAGSVYSTYVPWSTTKGADITGISFNEICSDSDYSNAGDFVAGSIQDSTNMSGDQLEYPIYSLTTEGNGKTGPDSGMAYEWNHLTGDKVWVVNTAYGATNIDNWVPGGYCYDRSMVIWDYVLQTYEAEKEAGHYEDSKKLVFWQQGETADSTALTPDEYENEFSKMYSGMSAKLGNDALPFGIIMTRAGYATNKDTDYRDANDLKMTGPRIAQYWLGSGNNSYSNVYVVSNVNEQWVSDSGVESYFQNAYPEGILNYTMHGYSNALPTTVSSVHYDIHYSQIGHNENGITAVDGMFKAINGSTGLESISWKDADGKTITSLNLEFTSDTAIAVPVANPSYAAKALSCSVSGNTVSYDASTGIVLGKTSGSCVLMASGGGVSAELPVTVTTNLDLTRVAGNYTGLYPYEGTVWYLKNGIIQINYESVVKDTEGVVGAKNTWWYVENGRVNDTYTGFAENSNGWWYIEKGKVTFNTNSVIKDTNKKIDGEATWWYVVGSEVQVNFTGLADYSNSNGWWYIEKGKVTFTANTIAKNKNGWYYIEDSKVNFNYNGFGKNSNGLWYCENGKVNFNKNDVLKDTTGAIGTQGAWYYVLGSEVQTSYTGVADYKNANGWWYIKNGQVDFTANTIAKNKNGWWYVEGGKVIFSYNGFGKNSNGSWYCEDGKVTFNKNDVLKDTTGALGTKGTWYYVVGSKVQSSYTGVANYKNSNGWWYIKNGQVDFSANTVAKNNDGWWYVLGGKVQVDFTGLADYKNSNGWWYIKNGKVDFSASGVYKNKNGWWYVTGGKVDFSYNGIARNSNGWWYIKDGQVDFNYNGTVKVSGVTYSVINGKVAR